MINPKSELYQWGPVKGRIQPVSYFASGTMPKYVKIYKISWPECYFIFHNNYMTWINDDAELRKSGKKNFYRWMLNRANRKKVERRYNQTVRDLFALQKQITKKYLNTLTNPELLKFFVKWQNLYEEFWVHGAVPEICNWGGEKLVAEILENKIGQSEKFNKYYELLSAPTQLSFYQTEEVELLKILKYKSKSKIFNQKISEHQQQYFWLLNNYYRTKILSVNYFKERLKGIKNGRAKIYRIINQLKATITKKRQLIRKLKISQKEKAVIEGLDFGICWQDRRKAVIMQVNHSLDLFLWEIAQRTTYQFNELKSLLSFEVAQIIQGKQISQSVIKQRDKYFVFWYDKEKLSYLEGKSAKTIADKFTIGKKNVQEIKGLVVSKGQKVRGKVRVIKSFQQLKSFKKGEILVTPMTSPEYVVAMRKAKAIITDGGSMTCHAAIVARELKIPCIVNTKMATKILKNGDLVEVSSERGYVKLIGGRNYD